MGEIYSIAAKVDIWVGKTSQDSPEAIPLIEHLAGLLHEMDGEEIQRVALNDSKFDSLGRPPPSSSKWKPVAALMNRNWFKRAWVIQEVALAKKASLFYGNKGMISWKVFLDAMLMTQQLGWVPVADEISTQLIKERSPALYFVSRINVMKPLLQNFESYQRHPLFLGSDELTGTNACEASASHLLALLLMDFNKVKATMPHDKVYSLLGVVNDAASVMGVSPCTFEVDYGASPADVFKAATTKIVNDNDHLGFISVAGLTNYGRGTDISPSFHQPSWVPDLSDFASCARTIPLLSIRGGHKARWDASRYGELGSLGFRILGPHLHVKAHRVGRLLDGSYPAWDLGYHYKIKPFAALLLRCGRRYKPTGELSIEAFWRPLIFNTDAHNSPTASSELSSYFKAWLAGLIFRNLDVWHHLSPENLSAFQQMTDYQSLAERDGISARSMLPSNEWMTRRLQKLQPSDVRTSSYQ
ncbi:hypothetical protein ACHAPJ_008269 [Fusarium lateritium]